MPITLASGVLGFAPIPASSAPTSPTLPALQARPARAVAFDVSRPLREVVVRQGLPLDPARIAPDPGPIPAGRPFRRDRAVQTSSPPVNASLEPELTFEGLANSDNPRLVSPPDPVGDVGPDHYVEMVNIAIAVYSRTGTLLLGPLPIGALWDGFEVDDCTFWYVNEYYQVTSERGWQTRIGRFRLPGC